MTLIDGIGGTFLFSNDPKRLSSWYRDILQILPDGEDPECNAIYKAFEYRDLSEPSLKKTITWAILPAEKDISKQPRTGQINYRVKNMELMLAHLRAKEVTVEETADYDYGKFAWILDTDGNRVELFEEASKSV